MRRRVAAEAGTAPPPPPEESLFTTQLPAGSAQDGGIPGVTTGTAFMVLTAGTVKGIRFYAQQITATDTYVVELWQGSTDVTGVRLGFKSVLGSALAAAPGWQYVAFDAPVAVSPGTVYVADQNNNHLDGGAGESGRYVYDLNFWAAGSLTVGNLVGLQDNVDPGVGFTVRNGKSRVNSASDNFPNGNFSATNYFADVVFQADA
jgi:hypothetical protein